jgi:hypothetical protein
MHIYELTFVGFDIDEPSTNDLVKWIKSPSRVAVDHFMAKHLIDPCLLHDTISSKEIDLDKKHREGTDIVIDAFGNVKLGKAKMQYWPYEILSAVIDRDIKLIDLQNIRIKLDTFTANMKDSI